LGQFILGLELLRFPAIMDRWVLVTVLAPLTLSWLKLIRQFRGSRSASVESYL
jgi:hypothetical protein